MDSLRISLLTSGSPSHCPTVSDESVMRFLINHKRRKNRSSAATTTTDSAEVSPRRRRLFSPSSAIPSLGCVIYEAPVAVVAAAAAAAANVEKEESGKKKKETRKRRRITTAAEVSPPPPPLPPLRYTIPPYEYCSIAMLNHLRLGHKADRVLTDKGGTVKNILQSNKSFIHYLITYPLKNTFRGYIQIAPYLAPRHIALPYHHATRLFSIDVERDATRLHARPTGPTCGSLVCSNRRFAVPRLPSTMAVSSDDDDDCECELWPDEKCVFYFETTRNFSLVLKRDPCIHNGSVVGIVRVYVHDRALEYNDSIHISPFVLKHLNADFDGDAVTIMIVRGIESACELESCLDEPMLFDSIPRFTFCQSMVFWIFRMLAFDDEVDELRCSVEHGDTESDNVDPIAASRLLHDRLDLWRNGSGARERAKRVFGVWLENYERVLRRVWREKTVDAATDDAAWAVPVWRQRAILDLAYTDAVKTRHDRDPRSMLTHLQKRIWRYRADRQRRKSGGNGGGAVVLLNREILCLENWIIVHSGAKATPRDLMTLSDRYRERGDDENPPPPYLDFFRECDESKELEYRRYLDDFVVISKHVPKSSYFASGLKWATQMCSVSRGDLRMKDRLLLRDVAYYFDRK